MKTLLPETHVLVLPMVVGIIRIMRMSTGKIYCICSIVIKIILAIITCNQCIRATNGGCGFSHVQPHLDLDMNFSKRFLDIVL